ncbi:Uncharacterized protein APZ42_017638 [Daphnia magna]|uniref:Uncharacterized protein n=1 Tax=Daphnia magna TaxID=35525 RepID=A0A164ZYW2_9CRUS|nr:Uncharacterized protein APZ42_017638 [Daphnia magna]
MGQLKIPENRQKSQIFLNMKNRDFRQIQLLAKTRHSQPKFDNDHENPTRFFMGLKFLRYWLLPVTSENK